jgi:hypothetical protein
MLVVRTIDDDYTRPAGRHRAGHFRRDDRIHCDVTDRR